MGKKKADGAAAKKEKSLSVSAILATTSKPKPKPKTFEKPTSYTDGMDLPPSSNDNDDELFKEDETCGNVRGRSSRRTDDMKPLEATSLDERKREKKERLAAEAAARALNEALGDDRDAFTVVIGQGEDSADANVKDISIQSFSVSARGKELLWNASVKIAHGKRYGLVGPNGMGKSTLLKLLAWRKIPVPKNIDVLLVEQEVVGDERSALDAVLSANEELVRLHKEVETLQTKLSVDAENNSGDDDDSGKKLAELYERLDEIGAAATKSQASKILAGLGFTEDMQVRATKSYSGGWRMRISLARALFIQPALLLLDEPTNHLDRRAVLWLEEYLCRWKKTLVVVSHDRDFLNTVCSEIIHLHDKKLQLYRGNFDDFERGYEQRRKEGNKKFEVHEKQVKAAQRTGNHQAQQKKVEEAPKKWRDYSVHFHFPQPTEVPPPLMQLKDVDFRYPNKDEDSTPKDGNSTDPNMDEDLTPKDSYSRDPNRNYFKLSNINIGIDMGTRVAIVGPNGAGKSTLLNLLAGDIIPTKGEALKSQKLRIGRYSQHFVDLLTMDESPVQYLLRLHPEQEGLSKQEAVRARLGKFGLPSHNHVTPIVNLSGGQKARVVFTSISMSEPHILLLDEPTNHLDMQSIDALADALDEFTGGVVLVSHDSRLISRVCEDEVKSQIWIVENGTVESFHGTFDEYKEDLQNEIKAEVDE